MAARPAHKWPPPTTFFFAADLKCSKLDLINVEWNPGPTDKDRGRLQLNTGLERVGNGI